MAAGVKCVEDGRGFPRQLRIRPTVLFQVTDIILNVVNSPVRPRHQLGTFPYFLETKDFYYQQDSF